MAPEHSGQLAAVAVSQTGSHSNGRSLKRHLNFELKFDLLDELLGLQAWGEGHASELGRESSGWAKKGLG